MNTEPAHATPAISAAIAHAHNVVPLSFNLETGHLILAMLKPHSEVARKIAHLCGARKVTIRQLSRRELKNERTRVYGPNTNL